MKKQSFLTILTCAALGLFVVVNTGCKKKKGCTDPNSLNFDAAAEQDDGSCDLSFFSADGIRGGKLYSKFWASETQWVAPSNINVADISDYGNFYRCKQCHGWDQMGKEGVYNNRAANTGRPSVGINLLPHIAEHQDDPQDFFDEIKAGAGQGRQVDPSLTLDGTNGQGDDMPEFGKILSDQDIWDLVKFLFTERNDVTQLYDLSTAGIYPNGTHTFSNIGKDGDAAAGNTYYTDNCATCHGADGKLIPIVDDGETLSVGHFGRFNPHETQHKVKFGNLGSSMTGFPDVTITDLKNLLKALQDDVQYPE